MIYSQVERDLRAVRLFFEELIACVVGCACWEPGWDDPADVEHFAQAGFYYRAIDPTLTPVGVLAALDRCFEQLDDFALIEYAKEIELEFADAADFRRFFGAARERLRAALTPASGAEPSADGPAPAN